MSLFEFVYIVFPNSLLDIVYIGVVFLSEVSIYLTLSMCKFN